MSPFTERPIFTGSPPHARAGFTLVEVIVATVVLAVGLLALTGAGAAIVRLERRGDRLAHEAAVAETRLELLRAEGCSAVSGTSDLGHLVERWTVMALSNGVREIVDSITDAGVPAGAAPRTRVYRSASRC
jgi:prepilin-type N-terminal cleavage/methylation domain-containing protein